MDELCSAEADGVVPQCFADLLEIYRRCVKETDMKMSEDGDSETGETLCEEQQEEMKKYQERCCMKIN